MTSLQATTIYTELKNVSALLRAVREGTVAEDARAAALYTAEHLLDRLADDVDRGEV